MCSKNCRRYFMRISSPEKETLTRKSPPSAEHTTFSGVDGACSQYQRKLANANYVNTSRTNGVNESAEPESDEEDVVGFVRVRLQVLSTQPKADALTGEMGQARGRARTRAKTRQSAASNRPCRLTTLVRPGSISFVGSLRTRTAYTKDVAGCTDS